MNNAIVYDFETLGVKPQTAPVVSIALLNFDTTRFLSNPYTYRDLLDAVKVMKFNVEDQVINYGKKIEKDTLDWWSNQSVQAQKQLAPSKLDVGIDACIPWFAANISENETHKVYTRNNTFDPMFLESLCKDTGHPLPYSHWNIRDTKSTIDGMTWGHNIKDNFIPEGLEEHFVAHDPAHDVAMDVMRLQYLADMIQ